MSNTKKKNTPNKNYDASAIQSVEGVEAVRKRPGMYVGHTGPKGNSHCFREGVDNSVDEKLVGHCTTITTELDLDEGVYTIEDDGRGIPVVKDPTKYKKGSIVPQKDNVLYTILTKLHSGGKFDKTAYQVSGGLNGVGTTCINALSDYLQVTSMRDGFIYQQEYSAGHPTSELEVVGATKKTGTTFVFRPDVEIMKTTDIDLEETLNDLKVRAFLNPGLKININTIKDGKTDKLTHYYEDGIVDLLKETVKDNMLDDVISLKLENPTEDIVEISLAFTYRKGFEPEYIDSFANGINTTEGGTHVTAFRKALTDNLSKFMKDNKLIPSVKNKPLEIKGDDYRESVVCVISVKHTDPEFVGQTKRQLGNTDIQGKIMTLMNNEFMDWLNGNPDKAKLIVKKVVASAKGRAAAKKAKEAVQNTQKNDFLSFSDFGKLADCNSDTPDEEAEIYICEGDSASGTLKNARDPLTQAIFPLRGKILNTFGKSIGSFIGGKNGNAELTNLVRLMRAGIGDTFDKTKFRYKGGVIIATDADKDGAHIASLLLTLFAEFMPEIIEEGWLKIACPPLYAITEKGKREYFITDDDYQDFIINRAMVLAEKLNVTTSKKQLKMVMKKLFDYDSVLTSVSSKYGSADLIELMAITNLTNEEEFIETLQSIDELIIDELDGDYLVTGYYDNEFQFIVLNEEFFEDLAKIEENIYHLVDKDGNALIEADGEDILQPSFISKLIKKATPATRQRFKGLGENNADELKPTIMSKENRVLLTVRMDNIEEAKEMVSVLFNPNNPDARKDFIINNQDLIGVEELDV